MNINPRYQRRSVRVKLTAMIDVVFLLIIFFMTVSQIDQDQREDMPLAIADTGQEIIDRDGRFIVNVHADGGIIVAKQELATDAFKQLMQQQVQQRGADAITCVLRIHQQTAFTHIQDVLGALAHSGIWQIRFSVVEEAL